MVDELQTAGKTVALISLKGDCQFLYCLFVSNGWPGGLEKSKSRSDCPRRRRTEPETAQRSGRRTVCCCIRLLQLIRVTARADVVFPATIWSEMEGHFLNLEGKIQKTVQVVILRKEFKSYHDVMDTCAKAAGVKLDGDWKKAVNKNLLVTDLIEPKTNLTGILERRNNGETQN